MVKRHVRSKEKISQGRYKRVQNQLRIDNNETALLGMDVDGFPNGLIPHLAIWVRSFTKPEVQVRERQVIH